MRIAVTGAAGRLGTGVVELLLARGHVIVGVDRVSPVGGAAREDLSWTGTDMADYGAVARAFEGCDAVVHLAAIPGPGRDRDADVHNNNVIASYNALRAAVEVGITRICQASSINAIGGAYSRSPRYDYFPVDEHHSTYNEDPYSLSKWICEQQADSIARRYEDVAVTSLRLHGVFPGRHEAVEGARSRPDVATKHLWGYTSLPAAAGACLQSLEAGVTGHEVFEIVAPDHVGGAPSGELAATYYPGVPLRRELGGTEGFFDCSKADRLLGWRHELW